MGVYVIKNGNIQVNNQIRDKEVRVIDASGKMIGIMSAKEALRMAEKSDLDLVKISSNVLPPVCKIMDYKKYIFDLNKKQKEMKKNQKAVVTKKIRMSSTIEKNDLSFKEKNASKFLSEGNKVKVCLIFREREPNFETAEQILSEFANAVKDFGIIEKAPNMEGRNVVMILARIKTKIKINKRVQYFALFYAIRTFLVFFNSFFFIVFINHFIIYFQTKKLICFTQLCCSFR